MTSPLATLSEDTTIRHATPADVSAMHARVHELAQFEKRIDVFVATQSGLHDALFGPASSADAACIWRIYTCNRRSEARDWPPNAVRAGHARRRAAMHHFE